MDSPGFLTFCDGRTKERGKIRTEAEKGKGESIPSKKLPDAAADPRNSAAAINNRK